MTDRDNGRTSAGRSSGGRRDGRWRALGAVLFAVLLVSSAVASGATVPASATPATNGADGTDGRHGTDATGRTGGTDDGPRGDGTVDDGSSGTDTEGNATGERDADGASTASVGSAGTSLSTASAGPNLLTNPGCEDYTDVNATYDVPNDWIDTSTTTPSMSCFDPSRFSQQVAPEGSRAFVDGRNNDARASAAQVVPVTGGVEYELFGQVGTDDALSATDDAEVRVRYLDGSGTPVSGGEITLTGLRSDTDTAFDTFAASSTAPAGAQQARVSIVLTNTDGYSDAFLDDLSFRTAPAGLTANDDGPFSVDVARTLSPSTTLFDNNGEGADDLGSGGEIESFGGGDLGGSVTDSPAGSTVPLAGGDLTVNADGTFGLASPTAGGTYTFQYRLSDGTETDDANVTIEVIDETLITPSCEIDGSGVPTGWTDDSPNTNDGVTCTDLTSFTTNQNAPDGGQVFGDGVNDGEDKVLQQAVPVLPAQGYEFAGRVGTDYATLGDDEGEVRIEYLDGSGNVVAGSGEELTGLRSDTDDAFDRFALASTSPSNAERARVVLTFVNADGSGYADVFFDDLSIERVDPAPTAEDDGPFSVDVGETLAPSTTLYDDNGDGPDDRGSPQATVESFGGGDLGGSVTDNPAGSSVGLAGGTLAVNADGTFSLTNPTQGGAYAFDYRLANATEFDDATVTITVVDNALLNPSCEADGTGVPSGWTLGQSTGADGVTCLDLSTADYTTQTPPDGSQAFGDGVNDGSDKVLRQEVLVEGDKTYRIAGAYGTDSANSASDDGEVRVRYLDSTGAVLSGGEVTLTGLRSDTDTEFDTFSRTTTAPSGAERARIELTFRNADGTDYAEVFFDNLSFDLRSLPPTAIDDGPFEVDSSGTLAPSTTLFDDNGNGTDGLGLPEATVASFGGGDLDGSAADNPAGTTAAFAGGTLTVNADGSFSLTGATAGGTYTFDYLLENDAGSDTATVTVVVPEAEVAVLGAGTEIASGDATPSRADGTDFGRVAVEEGPATTTFTVENRGAAPLGLDGAPIVNVTGANATAFAVASAPASTVPGGTNTSFVVSFDPDAEGVRTATVSIPTNDSDEDPYAFAIAGTGRDPLAATTGAATGVTASSATVAGTVDPGGDAADATVEYYPTGSPGDATTVATEPATVSGLVDVPVNATLTGLTPATNYTYRVVATNGTATVEGATAAFATPATSPTATTGNATNVSSTAATLRGTVNPGGEATTVEFEYSPAGDPGATTTVAANESPVAGTTGLPVTATVTGLAPETDYVVRVLASNDLGSDRGADRTVTTRSEPPVLVATGPFAADETAPNGTVVGDVDATDGEGGAVDDNVTYALAGGSPDPDPDGDGTPAFAIDADDGRLRVTDADDLDHEANASSALEVRVDDDAGRSTNATVRVDVRDVAPTLATQSLGAVGDAAPAGTVVGTVDAGGDDTSVSYRIADGNPAVDGDGTPAFSIDAATGEVAVADPDDLDAGTATAVALTVAATDGSTTARAVTTVSVSDTTAPTADAGRNRTVEVGQSTVLDATGSTDNVGIAAFEWDVGDDGTVDATGSTVNYTFDAVGETVVALTVTDAAGNANDTSFVATVEDTTPPDVPAVPNRTVDEDVPVAFDASGTTDEGTVASYEWAFGDGSANASGANVSHTYAQPGTYVAVLTVTDGAGNVARASGTVVVRDVTPPVARLVANRTSVLTGGAVRFDATNSTDNANVTGYDWSFGDGTIASGSAVTPSAGGSTVTHVFGEAGTYTVTLTARDAAGNADTATATVRVDAPGNLSVELLGTTAPVTAGEPLNATVEVRNRGTLPATQTLTLAVDDGAVASRTVTVEGGENRTVTLSWATRDGDAGTRTLSVATANDTAERDVEVEALAMGIDVIGVSRAVALGETATVALEVTNPGRPTVTRTVALTEGVDPVDATTLTLAPGETRSVRLRWNTTGATVGDHPFVVTTGNAGVETPISVIPPNPFPDGLPGERGYTPRDVDDDPLHEDIQGDGDVDFLDVITLLFADWATINRNPAQRAALDVDGDGRVGFLDVVTLLFE